MNKYYLAIPIALVLAFLAGKYSTAAETKTVIQEKIVYRDKIDDTKSKDTVTKIVQTKKPDGTVVTVTDRETKSDEHKIQETDSTLTSSQTTTTENRPDWRLGLGYIPGISGLQSQGYEAILQRRILSEIYVGVQADTQHRFGVNISVGF